MGPQACFLSRGGSRVGAHSWEQYLPASHRLAAAAAAADCGSAALGRDTGRCNAVARSGSTARGDDIVYMGSETGLAHDHDHDEILRQRSSGGESSTTAGRSESEAGEPSLGFQSLSGHVWRLSQDPKGCRIVQEALEQATCEQVRVALATQLRGHMVKASCCPQANYVVQKCISTMHPSSCQFIIDEMLEHDNLVAKMTRHRYGCRIVQELLKRCSSEQLRGLTEVLLADFLAFSCHPFGSYVMQQLVEHGTLEQKDLVNRMLEKHASVVCQTSPGCNVVAAALTHGACEDRLSIARALLQEPGLVPGMAQLRHGHIVVRLLLEIVTPEDCKEVVQGLREDLPRLQASRFGQQVADLVESRSATC